MTLDNFLLHFLSLNFLFFVCLQKKHVHESLTPQKSFSSSVSTSTSSHSSRGGPALGFSPVSEASAHHRYGSDSLVKGVGVYPSMRAGDRDPYARRPHEPVPGVYSSPRSSGAYSVETAESTRRLHALGLGFATVSADGGDRMRSGAASPSMPVRFDDRSLVTGEPSSYRSPHGASDPLYAAAPPAPSPAYAHASLSRPHSSRAPPPSVAPPVDHRFDDLHRRSRSPLYEDRYAAPAPAVPEYREHHHVHHGAPPHELPLAGVAPARMSYAPSAAAVYREHERDHERGERRAPPPPPSSGSYGYSPMPSSSYRHV